MTQFFCNYTLWEDFKSGMYSLSKQNNEPDLVYMSVGLLSCGATFYGVMRVLINEWPIATKVNLTNLQQNRRAWLGAAACCFNHGATEIITRTAWNLLDKSKQDAANIEAEKIIIQYVNSMKNVKTLFGY